MKRLALTAALLWVGVACAQPGREVRRDVAALVPRTVASGPLPTPTIVQKPGTIEASWTVPLTTTWPEYSRWLQTQLAPEYHVKSSSTTEIVLVRILDADIYRLTLRPDDRSVRATLIARPF